MQMSAFSNLQRRVAGEMFQSITVPVKRRAGRRGSPRGVGPSLGPHPGHLLLSFRKYNGQWLYILTRNLPQILQALDFRNR